MSLRTLNRADLWFTGDGDFLIDGSGDLKDTKDSGNIFEGVRQALLHRLIGEKNAWRQHPEITAGLERFIGDAIDDQLLEELITETNKAIKADSEIDNIDIIVRAFELLGGTVAVLLFINVQGQEHPIVTMAYNIQAGSVSRVK